MKLLNLLMLTPVILLLFGVSAATGQEKDSASTELTMVVMDPLCDKLACDCVEGYAQRKYEVVGEFFKKKLGREVKVLWGESVQAALEDQDQKRADIVIGKHSVVQSDAETLKWKLLPVAQLTGSDGAVTQTGLIVVRKNDSATRVSDLKDYRIFFGPGDCDEKYKAPMELLRDHGIAIPAKPEVSGACSEAATKLMELDDDVAAAAVISSYAEPLLAGCGTIEKGDLRVIGKSEEVPFVTAFVNAKLPETLGKEIKDALLAIGKHSEILKSLQSAEGFVEYEHGESKNQTSKTRAGGNGSASTAAQATKKN